MQKYDNSQSYANKFLEELENEESKGEEAKGKRKLDKRFQSRERWSQIKSLKSWAKTLWSSEWHGQTWEAKQATEARTKWPKGYDGQ